MKNSSMPQVRIGMIQSADQVQFKCDGSFQAVDLTGRVLADGKANQEYSIRIKETLPAEINYRVRLAIAETKAEAEQIQTQQKKRGYATELKHTGLVIQVGERSLDNHDYWIVTEPFVDMPAANKFAQSYEPVGEAVVIKDVLRKSSGKLLLDSQEFSQGVRIVPKSRESRIHLANVTVGIEFHWQHQRTQLLPGILEIGINTSGTLVAINELDIEDYLVSVNSSEMTAENPPELLKAQTIAARSTILATMGKHHYDENFHLCADDHCQCYHGMASIAEASVRAAQDTRGENLMYGERVCDARYAKICGGVMEDYGKVWDNRDVPYLVAGVDGTEGIQFPLDNKEKVRDYVNSSPDVYCNTLRYKISSALPYDSVKLFRWKVSYAREDLQDIIQSKIGAEVGNLVDVIPGERGTSGRLIYLDIVGSKKTVRVGKELQIRRAMSKSHLYSACFYVERERDESGKITHFHLIGAGWGHGVGLCQVGATVMAQEGFDYRAILAHYYKNSTLQKLY